MKQHLSRRAIKAIAYSSALAFLTVAGVSLLTSHDSIDFDLYGEARLMSLSNPTQINSKPKDVESLVLLNDPAISRNWGLAGTDGKADISVFKAWNISKGSKDIVVGIIDTGIDIHHPDLKDNLWVNQGEVGLDKNGKDKRTNGIDDDNNGCIDDVHGCNFITGRGDVEDRHGHGCSIAGIVGAKGGNGIGISGVSPEVSLMVLKYYDPTSRGNDNLKNTIKAIDYAVRMNAKIINYSGGGLEKSDEEYSAIKRAQQKGILFVAAAGNEYSNSDQAPYYPANYGLDNIISVTAIDPKTKVLTSSNFGENTVDIAAPGEQIYSTLPGGKYGAMTGTSQATAFVTGVAALIMANNKHFDYKQVKKQILSTADFESNMKGKTRTSGKLNSFAALAIQPNISVTGLPVNLAPLLPREENSEIAAIGGLVPETTSPINSLSPILEALSRKPANN
ncbi:MAG: serine protease/subtilase [Bdellovibrionales bacterium CG10_big_fil_rev_8_21_14_0_10_45_34]|nr:MAG: serine protease/subtilase [Bdellovibrionales bacterium CG10_big_fil_rev_8_21_14_0_10_45_34]